jgi:glyoxylase-like metal-dependent hydrolase (beta-lactamase superfamily II)
MRSGVPNLGWALDEIEEVARDVFRIPVPIPIVTCPAVNVYALVGDSGATLIDCGWAMERSAIGLGRGLARIGLETGDVHTVLVTHAHRDHYPLAMRLRRDHGVTVRLGRGEKQNLASLRTLDQQTAFGSLHVERLIRGGARDLATRMWSSLAGPPNPGDWAEPDAWLSDGETVNLSRHELRVQETPGHTAGHVAFRDGDRELLFSGDHLLTDQVPTIGYERHPGQNPLATYLESVADVRASPDARVLPGHGPVDDSSHRRADELAAYFADYLDAVLVWVSRGAATASSVADAHVAGEQGVRLAEHEPAAATQAVLNASYALQLLEAQGRLLWTADDGVDVYGVVAS